MPDLSELYQSVILDHNRKPRNFRPLDGARKAEGYNPLCGDHLTVWLKLKGDTIEDVSFQGSGCAISQASASLMTTVMQGKDKAEAKALFDRFRDLVTGKLPPEATQSLGRLAVFAGVSAFPIRVKCATLSWHALLAAMEGSEETVSTE